MFYSECSELKENSFEARPEASSAGVIEGMGDVMTKEVTADEVASAVAAASDEIEDILLKEELCDMDRAKRIGVELADFSAELGMLAGLTDEEHKKAGFPSIFDIALGGGPRDSGSSTSSSWSGDHDRRRSRPPRPKRIQNEGGKRQTHGNTDVSDEGATGDERDAWTTDQSGTSDASTPKESESGEIADPPKEFVLPQAELEAAEPVVPGTTPREHLLKILAENECEYFVNDGRQLNVEFSKFESDEEAISRYLYSNPQPVTPEEEALLLTHVCEWRSTSSDPNTQQETLRASSGTRRALRLIQAVEDIVGQKLPDNPDWQYSISLCCSCRLCFWLSEGLELTLRDIVTRLALEPSTTRDALTVLTECSLEPNNVQAHTMSTMKLSSNGADVVSECLAKCGEAASLVCLCRPRHNTSIHKQRNHQEVTNKEGGAKTSEILRFFRKNARWAVDALVCMLQRYRESLFFYKLEVVGPGANLGWLKRTTRNQHFIPPDDTLEAIEQCSCDCLRPTVLTMEQLLISSSLYKQSMLAWEKYEKLTEASSNNVTATSSGENQMSREIARIDDEALNNSDGGSSDGSWTSSSSLGTKDTLARLVKWLAAIEHLVERLAMSTDRVGVARSLSELETYLLAISSKIPALNMSNFDGRVPTFQEFSEWISTYTNSGSSRRNLPRLKSRRRPRPRNHLRPRRNRYFTKNLHKKLANLDLNDEKTVEVKPPKTFYYNEPSAENLSDTDTVVAEENLELCKEMQECFSRFANFILNAEDAEADCHSPPLELSPTETLPLYQASKNNKLIAVSKLLNKSTDTLDKLKFDLGRTDISNLTPLELGIKLANTKRISLLLKDVGDIRSDLEKINDISVDPGKVEITEIESDDVETSDPCMLKYMTFGVEIKKAIDECQSVINTCSSYIDNAESTKTDDLAKTDQNSEEIVQKVDDKDALSLDQIYEAILSLDKNSREIFESDAKPSELDAQTEAHIADVVDNMPQILANVPEIANKLTEIGNGTAELPEFASIMSSLPEIDNENQLTSETLKQIRDLKIAKCKGDTKISKSMKRKVARKSVVESPSTGAATGTGAEGVKDPGEQGPDSNLFNISAHELTRAVFEYIKESKKPELLSLLDHGAHQKMEQEQDKRFYEGCMDDVIRTNATSLDDVRRVFALRIELWRQRMNDKHKEIPSELLKAEIEDRTNKLYAYLNETVEKCGRKLLEKEPAKVKNVEKNQEKNAESTEKDSTDDTYQLAPNDVACDPRMDYFNIMSRHAESAKLALFLWDSPEDALRCIAQIQCLQFQHRRLPADFHTQTKEQRMCYILRRISELNTAFVASLSRENATADGWLYLLYRLDLTKARVQNALSRVTSRVPSASSPAPAPAIAPTTPVAPSSGEQLVARGLSLMINRASNKSKALVEPERDRINRLVEKCHEALATRKDGVFLEECVNLAMYLRGLTPANDNCKSEFEALCELLGEPLAIRYREMLAIHNEEIKSCENQLAVSLEKLNESSSKPESQALSSTQSQTTISNVPAQSGEKNLAQTQNKQPNAAESKHVCSVARVPTPPPSIGGVPARVIPSPNPEATPHPPASGTGACIASAACGECRSGDPPCNCCYCTVFGHAPPQTTPVPKNFNETRERLRSILNRKKQLTKEEEIAERKQVHQMLTQTLMPSQQQTQPQQQQPVKLPPKVMHKIQQQQNQAIVTNNNNTANGQTQASVQPQVHITKTNPPKPQSAATPVMKPVNATGAANPITNAGACQALNNANSNTAVPQQKLQMPLKSNVCPPHMMQQQVLTNQQQLNEAKVRDCASIMHEGRPNLRCGPPIHSSRDSSLESTSSGYSHRWIEDPRSLDDLLLYIEGPSRPTKAKKQAKKARQRAKKVEAGLLEWRAELDAHVSATKSALAHSRQTLAEVNARANALRRQQHNNAAHSKKSKKKQANKTAEVEALLNREIKTAKTLVFETETYLADLFKAIEMCDHQLSEVRQQVKLADSFSENKNVEPNTLKQVATQATKQLKKPPELVKNLPPPPEYILKTKPSAQPPPKQEEVAKNNKENKTPMTPPVVEKQKKKEVVVVAAPEVQLTKKQKKEMARKQAEEARLLEEKRRKEEEKTQKQMKKNSKTKDTNTNVINIAATKQHQKQALSTSNTNAANSNINAAQSAISSKASKKQHKNEEKAKQNKQNAANKQMHQQQQVGADGCSIMHQLSCGVQVGDLKLPPGITLTRVDSNCKPAKQPAAPSLPITQINTVPIWNRPTPPTVPQPVLLVSNPGEPAKPMIPEPPPSLPASKSKKSKKKSKKTATGSGTDNPGNRMEMGGPGTKMVTLRNPMFHPNLPPVQISSQGSTVKKVPEHIRIPEPIPMPRGACQATITPTSNGMYTIRNPLVAAQHRQSPSYPASYVVSGPSHAQQQPATVHHPATVLTTNHQPQHPVSAISPSSASGANQNHHMGPYNHMGAFSRTNEGYSLFQPSSETSCSIAPQHSASGPTVHSAALPDPIGPPPIKKPDPPMRPPPPCAGQFQDSAGHYSLFEDSLPYFQRLRAHKEQIRPESASEQCSFGGAWSYEHSRQQQQQHQQQMMPPNSAAAVAHQQQMLANSSSSGSSSASGSLYTHTDHLNLFTDGFGGLSEMIKKSPTTGPSQGALYGAIGPRSNGIHSNLSDSGIFTSGSERESSCPWEMYLQSSVDK